MSGKYNNLNYIDKYACCGAYYEESANIINYGSPIIAVKVVKNNANRSVELVIIEQNKENLENLKKVIQYKDVSSVNISCIDKILTIRLMKF